MFNERKNRNHRRIAGLSETEHLMNAAIRDPQSHVFAAWKFSATGRWDHPTLGEQPAEATIAVSDDVKTRKRAKAIAKETLRKQGFTIGEIDFNRHDTSALKEEVEFVISALPR